MLLELSSHKTKALLGKYPSLLAESIDLNDVKESVKYLKQLNFTHEEILSRPTTFLQHPLTLANRKKVLEECCFREVKINLLQQFVTLMNKKIVTLKIFNYIDNNAKVLENLLKQLDIDVELKNEFGDEITLIAIRELIINLYLKEKLKMTDEQLKSIPKVHRDRLKHRSLESITKAVDVLQNKLEFSNERIISNAYLLYSCADNLNRLITEVPSIGGVTIKEILNKRPKVAINDVESIKSIIKHVKSFDIPEDRLLKSLEVFTLSSSTVYYRLVQMMKIDEFKVLRYHPRILKLIHYQNKARTRLDYLKQLNMKCVSLNVLSSASETFEKYARDGADKTRGQDTVLYVAETLHKDQHWVKNTFGRHPNWCHVPVLAVKESIDYLRGKNFTDKEITDNLHLLLYPVPRIEQKLNSVLEKKAKNELISGVAFSTISNSKLLSLCLYYIEAEFHFSGDGIWESSKHDHKQDISHTVMPEFPKSLSKEYRYGVVDKKSRKTEVQ